jgi:3-oxoacyl-[acyl-carrier-protein] synthase II
MDRVVITGVGVVSPIGSSFDESMVGVETGFKGIDHIKNFNTDLFPMNLAAEVKKNETVYKSKLDVDRKEVFINNAIEEIFKKNHFIQDYLPVDRILNLGTGIDYFDIVNYVDSNDARSGRWENYCKRSYKVVERLASKYEIEGGFSVNVAACVASTQAMGLSFRMLRKIKKKIIFTGGFDSMLCHLHYMGFYKLGAFSDWSGEPGEACRPFDKNRSGLVLGEGGVVYVFQREEEANKEDVLAELVGYSSTMDAYMVTAPDPEGKSLANAALCAIKEAGISPQDIDCIHLHGTGTPMNAPAESRALELIFGSSFKEIPVFSLKGQIGHLIGACGAMEMIGVIYSLQNQKVPPTVNFEDPDPEVPLRVIKGQPLDLKINYILKLNSSFGGQNTAFVLRRYE